MSILKQNLLKASLVLAVFISLNSVAKAYAPPLDTISYNVYKISNLNELGWLAMYVNDENDIASSGPRWTSRGKTFVLMNDIDGFSKSIGTYSHPFMGRFDGNGHKITLAVSTTDLYYLKLNAGVFGYTEGATIENLTVAGYIEYFDNSASGNPVGSIGAIVNSGGGTSINNCTNLADITMESDIVIDIGGIAGQLYGSKILNCSNSGNIIATGEQSSYIGGIVGYFQNFAMAGCVNIGKVKGKYDIGGIVGGVNADVIESCVNAGWVNGSTAIGGIIGRVNGLDLMHYCLNTGVVQGNSNVYSLIGYNLSYDTLDNRVSNCYYDNQMSPYAAIYGIANPPTVEGLSTEKLTKPEIKDALGPRWTICPNRLPLFLNQVFSYPILPGPRSDDGAHVAALAALPVRLSSGTYWNNVSSVVVLDRGYWIPTQSLNMLGGPLSWEAKQDGWITMPIGPMASTPNGLYYNSFHNPTPAYSGLIELTAYVENNGNIYKKTVPIITNGIPFKINISDYEMYGFEASEVSPNIVTSNAVMDVSSAVEGYLTVAIFDMSGAKVMEVVDKSVTAQSKTQVELNNLNNLSAGNYMVAVSLGNNVVFRRFVKQ